MPEYKEVFHMIQIRKKTYADLKQCLIFICIISLIFISSASAQTSPDDYEDDNSCELAAFISVNGDHQIHNLHKDGDEDWLMFYGIAGKEYTIEIINVETKGDPGIGLYDSNFMKILPDRDKNLEGEGETMDWTDCNRDGIYYIKVFSCGAGCTYGENTGYEIFVYEPNAPNNYPNITGTIIDKNTKQPIGNAKITISKNGIVFGNGSSVQDGKFVVNTIEPGNYLMEVEHFKYNTLSKDIIVEPFTELNYENKNYFEIEMQNNEITCIKGDINKDGIVLIDDVKKVFSFQIKEPTPEEFCAANVYDNEANDMVQIYPQDIKAVFNIFIGDN